MSRIDITLWGEYLMGDLFELQGIKQAKSQKMIPIVSVDDGLGRVPYVVQSRFNNMVKGYADRAWLIDHDEPPVDGNALALGVTLNACSYQPKEFGASQIITARSPHLTADNGFFVSAVVGRAIERFDYREKPGIEKYKALGIRLPAASDGSPDWDYMDAYMHEVLGATQAKVEMMRRFRGQRHIANSYGWRLFQIGGPNGLFRIEKGTRLTRANMREGAIPFIGASTANNGITAFVGNTDHLHPGNVITVAYNGQKATGKAFYQPKTFWASDDVHVLYPNFELNELRALFLLPIFRIVGEPYAFEDKWKVEYMEKDSLPLPVDVAGNPDWPYMEHYMADLMAAQRLNAKHLVDVSFANPKTSVEYMGQG